MSGWQPEPSRKTTRWLSREAAELFADAQRCSSDADAVTPAFDVLIIGSGYGGAIAAAELAGCTDASGRPMRIAVLERGREYLPGAFPSQLAELPTHLRGAFAGKRRGGEGLFDIRADGDVSVVQASGLGGGSLINAGVMEMPNPSVFDERWPRALRGGAALVDSYAQARHLLGATAADGSVNRIGLHAQHQRDLPAKTQVLRGLAPGSFREAAITVAMRDGANSAGVQLNACTRCGDCATGCNQGAKESLDTNLLVTAARRGADIWCGATALRLRRPRGRRDCWSVQLVHTDEQLNPREGREFWVGAQRVIIAAGALGSTELLLRTREACTDLVFSSQLGERFSGNGDMIAFGYGYGARARANAVADEDQPHSQRGIGPTITGIIETQAGAPGGSQHWPIVVEEMAVPGALRRAAEEVITTVDTLHRLAEYDGSRHEAGHPRDDIHAVHRERIRHMSIFAAMGDDGATGSLRLAPGGEQVGGDGQIDIVWPQARELPLFDAQVRRIDALAGAAGYEGRTFANPVWRFLPAQMGQMLGMRKGPPVTVHPLGGCAMADSVAQGVVDACGRVYDAGSTDAPFHDGLYVLDGAIVPCALAINPALTIAAVALRAVRELRAEWAWTPVPVQASIGPALVRPVLRDVERETRERGAQTQTGTVVGITERLAGTAMLRDRTGVAQRCRVELTLTYEPLRLARLFTPDREGRLSDAVLQVRSAAPSGTQLRILLHDEWTRIQQLGLADAERERLEAEAARRYAVAGTLTILQRAPSRGVTRVLGAGWAWLRNRGVRDAWQTLKSIKAGSAAWPGFKSYARDLVRLASHAGEIRRFDYALRIGEELTAPQSGDAVTRFEPGDSLTGGAIVGGKRITYARPGNPWRQLQELQLSEFAGRLGQPESARLVLDPEYFAERGHPLLRIEAQSDHVEALADLVSLAAYVLRMMLAIHIWNTRKPDAPTPRLVQRLPGPLSGLPDPELHWIDVDRVDGQPVRMRLTRYRRADASPVQSTVHAPVLLIHGYSASGTTFAHPALKPGLARDLALRGRDVWVADLRSSAGLPTATHPWTMEQVGLTDIPAAVDYVWRHTGQQPIDVVAHCMGAVMLSMAVLSACKSADELAELLRAHKDDASCVPVDRFAAERRALPARLRRVVLSQNGPVMVMSQQNVFRAYVMSYLEALFGPLRYDFRPDVAQGLAGDLFDRLLAGLPYPDEDLKLENSARIWQHTRFVGTRHRMDALYGRTFSLKNLDDDVLEEIDDLFGPLSLDTVAQVIHFSQLETITTRAGRNRFVCPEALQACWTFPTLGLHGAENGLADVATLYRLQAVMRASGRDIRIARLDGQGHQDSLIGTRSPETFAHIRAFLDEVQAPVTMPAPDYCRVQTPALGPILGLDAQARVHVGVGTHARTGRPDALCVLPIERDGGTWSYASLLSRLGLLLPQTLQPVTGVGDWFTLPLPHWAQAEPVREVLLLTIHACPDLPADGALSAAIDEALARLNADATAEEHLGRVDVAACREPVQGPLRIALGSCAYPPGIFNHEPAADAWRCLNARFDRGDTAQLLMLTGDQIYVDATAGMFDPAQTHDRYARPHEAWLRARPVRDALRRVPAVTLLDDHEIDDNWQPVAGRAGDPAFDGNERRRRDGVAHFLRYQRPAGGDAQALSLQFERQGARVFVLDTRTQRSLRASTQTQAAMLDESQQWAALEAWLLDPVHRDCPKLILSPAAILPRHRRAARAQPAFGRNDAGVHAALRSDGWDGYPATFYRLLALIAGHRVRRVVFLSGDEHLGLLVEARLRGPGSSPLARGVRLLSIHTPGLNTPYRFANARAADFILSERFRFGDGARTWGCALRTQTFTGAGFTWITLERSGDDWRLDVEYDDGSGAAQRRRSFLI